EAGRGRGRLLGIGIACYTEYTGIGSETYRRRGMTDVPGTEAATVRMEADGGVTCLVSFPSQGQGHATTTAQLVADQLGVPIEAGAGRAPAARAAGGGEGAPPRPGRGPPGPRPFREPRRRRAERGGGCGGGHRAL